MTTTSGKHWLERNLKWIILAAVLGFLLLLAVFIAAIAFFVSSVTRSSEVYQTAMSRAQAHPDVVGRLGTPIEPGWLVQGKIEVSDRSGEADIAIPIHGPRGEGSLSVVATKRGGTWRYEEVEVRFGGSAKAIDLRTAQEVASATQDEPDAGE